ncbi:hypothetical protein ACV0TY_005030, partial [Escherichia coli]|nr:hypothetical protein [Escherichia coli]
DYPGRVQIILSLYSWCSDNVYQERLSGILWRIFWDVLSGNTVEISIIESFSPSVINMLITEGGCLLKTDVLIGFSPEIIGNKIISDLHLSGLSISDAVLTGFRVYGQEIFWSINWYFRENIPY